MNLQNPIVHQIDTRQNATVTVFDGSHEDESKLAKQFWNSVLLMPPVESTLVCKEIHQRTRNRPLHEKNVKLPANIVKAQEEKDLKNKGFDEIAAQKMNEDEMKRIQAVRQRHEHIRQLFFKHATNNREKNKYWSISHLDGYSTNRNRRRTTNYYQDELVHAYYDEDDNDRQLVQWLPD